MTDAATEALKPCPFCGGKAKRFTLTDEANFGGDVIQCMGKCGASSHVEFDRKENLVSLWNERALSTPTPAGELREVNMRRVLIEAALCLSGFAGEGFCVEGFEDPADVYGRIVGPLELQNADDDDLRRALAQPGSGEWV